MRNIIIVSSQGDKKENQGSKYGLKTILIVVNRTVELHVVQISTNFFSKGSYNKYFRLSKPYGLVAIP